MSEVVKISKEQWKSFLDTNDRLLKKCEELLRREKELSERNEALERKIRKLEGQLLVKSSKDILTEPSLQTEPTPPSPRRARATGPEKSEDLSSRMFNETSLLLLLFSVFIAKTYIASNYWAASWEGSLHLNNAKHFVFSLGFRPGQERASTYYDIYSSPFFPWLTGLAWAAFGGNPHQGFLTIVIIQQTLHFSAVLVFFKLTKFIFNERVGFLASLLLYLNPVSFRWTNEIQEYGLELFFVSIALHFLLMKTEKTLGVYTLVGASCGLAVLTNSSAFLLLFPIGIFIFRSLGTVRLKLRAFWWVSSSFIVLLAPWFLWCLLSEGDAYIALAGYSRLLLAEGTSSWHWYVSTLPAVFSGQELIREYFPPPPIDLKTIPLLLLGLLGIIDMKSLKEKRRFFFLSWFICALLFFSFFARRNIRYFIGWLPSVCVLVGLGAERIYGWLRGVKLKPILTLFVLLLVFINFIPAFQVSYGMSELRHDPEFFEAVSWLQENIHPYYDQAATNFIPIISYYTERWFMDVSGIEQHQLRDWLEANPIKFLVVSTAVPPSYMRKGILDYEPYLRLVKSWETYTYGYLLVYEFKGG